VHQPKPLFILLFCSLISLHLSAQTDSSHFDKLINLPDKIFHTLDKKASSYENKLDKQTTKYLNKLQRQEHKLQRKLLSKDSLIAHQLFENVDAKYAGLKNTTGQLSKYETLYSGHLDSLSTTLNFLKNNHFTETPELQTTLNKYKDLQEQLNASEQIRKYLSQRQQLLKEQFEKLGMVGELKQFKKQVYYYQAQVQEYKAAFEDPSKIEQKLLELAQKLPQFKDFPLASPWRGSAAEQWRLERRIDISIME
jgi:hypothetical protein